jgi:predicted ferric reductase
MLKLDIVRYTKKKLAKKNWFKIPKMLLTVPLLILLHALMGLHLLYKEVKKKKSELLQINCCNLGVCTAIPAVLACNARKLIYAEYKIKDD